MQQVPGTKLTPRPISPTRRVCGTGTTVGTLIAFAALALGLPGCGGTPEPPPVHRLTFAGTRLTFSCPDPRLRDILGPMARAWAARTGATVEVAAGPMAPGDAAEVGVLPFAELGTWADRGELVPVPAALREPGNPYQWSAVLGVYRGEPAAGWGGQLFGLPLAGDGYVVVYRADRFADPKANDEFRARTGRALAAPAAWEDFAAAAAAFAARDKKPSLPRLAADPGRLADLFCRVAACYDRPAAGDVGGKGGGSGHESLAFQFRLDDARPRLETPGFRAAADWLAGLTVGGCLPADGPADPAAALAEDRAVLAVLSLADLMRLKKDGKVPERYGVAPLPGSAAYVDPATGHLTPTGRNYVPYIAGGWFGVVRTGCKVPAAAFDLLADLGGPARSLEVVAAGGYGPTRDTHLEPDRLLVWLGYGFDEERSKGLLEAVRQYVGKAVRNPAYGLRGPDHATLTAALGDGLAKLAAGGETPEEVLKRITAAWEKADAGTPPEKLKAWRRHAAGLN